MAQDAGSLSIYTRIILDNKTSMQKDARLQLLIDWVKTIPELENTRLTVASADASFRRYFRASVGDKSYIIMDAPPNREDIQPFISVTKILEAQNVHVPHIYKINLKQGFLLLDDLGDQQYLESLNSDSVDTLYNKALDSLKKIQQAPAASLPHYSAAVLSTEMSLFADWYIERQLGIQLSTLQRSELEKCFTPLIANATEQPQTFVHRDYHSRNLMLPDQGLPGVIDYQDAVLGPCTYDLVSLLRDCYIAWPEEKVKIWALSFKSHIEKNQNHKIPDSLFLRWFDLMGIQRHLKAIGIFARLHHRDGKPGYIKDIPRTLNYVTTVASQYSETKPLATLINAL